MFKLKFKILAATILTGVAAKFGALDAHAKGAPGDGAPAPVATEYDAAANQTGISPTVLSNIDAGATCSHAYDNFVAPDMPTASYEDNGDGTTTIRFNLYDKFDNAENTQGELSGTQEIVSRIAAADDLGYIMSADSEGNTDSCGNAAYNMRLSGERAERGKEALVYAGMDADKISVTAMGETDPIVAPGVDNFAHGANRRTELSIVVKNQDLAAVQEIIEDKQPVLNNDYAEVEEGSEVTLSMLENDKDIEQCAFNVTGELKYGEAAFKEEGIVTYHAYDNDVDAADVTDTFTYTCTMPSGASTYADVNIKVLDNDEPVVVEAYEPIQQPEPQKPSRWSIEAEGGYLAVNQDTPEYVGDAVGTGGFETIADQDTINMSADEKLPAFGDQSENGYYVRGQVNYDFGGNPNTGWSAYGAVQMNQFTDVQGEDATDILVPVGIQNDFTIANLDNGDQVKGFIGAEADLVEAAEGRFGGQLRAGVGYGSFDETGRGWELSLVGSVGQNSLGDDFNGTNSAPIENGFNQPWGVERSFEGSQDYTSAGAGLKLNFKW